MVIKCYFNYSNTHKRKANKKRNVSLYNQRQHKGRIHRETHRIRYIIFLDFLFFTAECVKATRYDLFIRNARVIAVRLWESPLVITSWKTTQLAHHCLCDDFSLLWFSQFALLATIPLRSDKSDEVLDFSQVGLRED